MVFATALALATGVADALAQRRHGAANESIAAGLKIYPLEGRYEADGPPGTWGATGLVGVMVTAPVTILDVRPYAVTPGVETIARAWFWGPRGISPSGHKMDTGAPGSSCETDPWPPPEDYFRSYPIEELRLATGDPVEFGYLVRPPASFGTHIVTGYRITYRTDNGSVHTITGDLGHLWYIVNDDETC